MLGYLFPGAWPSHRPCADSGKNGEKIYTMLAQSGAEDDKYVPPWSVVGAVKSSNGKVSFDLELSGTDAPGTPALKHKIEGLWWKLPRWSLLTEKCRSGCPRWTAGAFALHASIPLKTPKMRIRLRPLTACWRKPARFQLRRGNWNRMRLLGFDRPGRPKVQSPLDRASCSSCLCGKSILAPTSCARIDLRVSALKAGTLAFQKRKEAEARPRPVAPSGWPEAGDRLSVRFCHERLL